MNQYVIYIFLLFSNILFAQNIDSLLQEIKENSDKSLTTLDEKLGHVTIYSQKDLRLMQYTTLNDLLKELPASNLNKNKLGDFSLSLPGSKTSVSGFFRLFINDHEVSSNYTQAPSAAWMDFPMELVDYIEVYRGDSSFSLGSGNGVFFIRVYTKKASKENTSQLFATLKSSGSNSQSVFHADTLENGWSYLAYVSRMQIYNHETRNGNKIYNNSDKKYSYLNIQKDSTSINIGYTEVTKQNYFGLALDANPEDGKIVSQDYFIDFTTYFADDESIKFNLSYDVNNYKYEELNNEGLGLIPLLDFTQGPPPSFNLANERQYHYNNTVAKSSASLSKVMRYGNNNFLAGFNYRNMKYETKENRTANDIGEFNDFNQEETYSLFIQDDYKINENLVFVLNGKADKGKRAGTLDDFDEIQYRLGAIYNINENFGLKSFYSKTYLAPSFLNIDYADADSFDMKNQYYKSYSIEGVYAHDALRFSVTHSNTKVENFIYFTPVGFTNIDHTISSENFIFDFIYKLSSNNKLNLNYFTTKLSETLNNSSEGGYIKFTGEYDSFEYFTSLIYRNSYQYLDVHVGDSYNFSMGTTYNVSKDIAISVKVENLFDNSTKSLYKEGLLDGDFAFKDYGRDMTFSVKWVF